MIPYKEVQKQILKIGKYQTQEDKTQILQHLTEYYHQETNRRQGLTQTQITPYQILQRNKKSGKDYSKQNEILFSEILEQAKDYHFGYQTQTNISISILSM